MNDIWKSRDTGCPCKECDRRTVTCHGLCTEYQGWKKEQEKRKAEEQKAKGNNDTMSPAKRKAIWKKMRYSRRGPRNTHKEG